MGISTARKAAKPAVHKSVLNRKEALIFYLLISPWLIHFIFLEAGPMLASLYFSFTEWNMLSSPEWIGLSNYVFALTEDPLFWKSLFITFGFAIISVPLNLIVGLMLALLLNISLPGNKLFRTIYYLPSQISGVAVMVMWIFVFNPELGLLNSFLGLFGIEGPGWIFDPDWALPSLVFMSLWSVGGGTIIWLAGLKGIPESYYESATLDGANAWKRLIYITLPLLTPTIFFNLITGIIGALQKFGEAYVMTKGGPLNSTRFFNYHLYDYAFGKFEMGLASALAWLLFLIILALTLLVFSSSGKWVYYGGEKK
ncbi:carbohydrate ABC transporter permease [Paenibacillus donghaensis]|uniref:ABC transporter permease n=1 Tax=Paenibacillus donghaensis TaxID=414771 RepID=A0A2Z2KHD8_9BACL|nr:sugar ABC transporter permease [Paenibacillus donghaensis]ASA21589.1 ABC transporter permease [Paenibacillus donghaensis]